MPDFDLTAQGFRLSPCFSQTDEEPKKTKDASSRLVTFFVYAEIIMRWKRKFNYVDNEGVMRCV